MAEQRMFDWQSRQSESARRSEEALDLRGFSVDWGGDARDEARSDPITPAVGTVVAWNGDAATASAPGTVHEGLSPLTRARTLVEPVPPQRDDPSTGEVDESSTAEVEAGADGAACAEASTDPVFADPVFADAVSADPAVADLASTDPVLPHARQPAVRPHRDPDARRLELAARLEAQAESLRDFQQWATSRGLTALADPEVEEQARQLEQRVERLREHPAPSPPSPL